MSKYRRVERRLRDLRLLAPERIAEPKPADRAMLQLVHTSSYVDAILRQALPAPAVRRLGFPLTAALAQRALHSVQGTIEAARDALVHGAGLNLAGGTHHAYADRGEGFCVFNDVAVAIRALQHTRGVQRVVVIDLDVHQGNGTAHVFTDDPHVFTLSMHGANNYPFRKERSRLDIALPDQTTDAEYLDRLTQHLGPVLDAAEPDLAFYLAGADPYHGDRFGRLGLTVEGLRRRDRLVYDTCTARAVPVATTLAGGYADDVADVVQIHINTVAEMLAAYA